MGFEIDERKLRSATEPNDKWLDTVGGRAFLFVGFAILGVIALALFSGVLLLMIAIPGLAIGFAIVAIIAASGLFAPKVAHRRRRTERPAASF